MSVFSRQIFENKGSRNATAVFFNDVTGDFQPVVKPFYLIPRNFFIHGKRVHQVLFEFPKALSQFQDALGVGFVLNGKTFNRISDAFLRHSTSFLKFIVDGSRTESGRQEWLLLSAIITDLWAVFSEHCVHLTSYTPSKKGAA